MNSEEIKIKNEELLKSLHQREKIQLTPDNLKKLNMIEIKAWAWCTCMGSDASILFLKQDGKMLYYNHYKYSDSFNEFAMIEQRFLSQKDDWVLYRCHFINNLYIRPEDKAWFDKCWIEFIRPTGSAMIAIECICQSISESKKNT